MIALATSIVVALYVVLPGLFFRWGLGLHFKLRDIERPKTQEIVRGFFSLLLPFLICFFTLRHVPIFAAKYGDYHALANGIFSDKLFEESHEAFYAALIRVMRRQSFFVFALCVIAAFEGGIFGWLAKRYGPLEHAEEKDWKATAATFLVSHFLHPNVSQWHTILTPYLRADEKSPVEADVLTTNGILYRGVIYKHFTKSDGSLDGLILRSPQRFDREAYLNKVKGTLEGRNVAAFWTPIAGTALYVFADKMATINVRLATKEDAVIRYVNKQAKGLLPKDVQVLFISMDDAAKAGSKREEENPPDFTFGGI